MLSFVRNEHHTTSFPIPVVPSSSRSKISDIKLAKATKDIDLIIGGHTHTFLDKPTEETNAVGKTVLVNQVGCFGLYLGKIDFYFESSTLKTSKGNTISV